MTKPYTIERSHHSVLVDYLISVSRGRRGLIPGLLRNVLGFLARTYCIGLEAYLFLYRVGLRQRTRLPCRVISIGNLTTGGTGKTPMTQALCRRLLCDGHVIAVLSRGYGGSLEHSCAVASDGAKVRLTAQEAGDEAYLLAKTLTGVPVIVGKDRRETGALAIGQFKPDVIVLDDGLQYWQLYRDLDIVMLNSCDPFDNGWTFPRGLLREPPSHLVRAGVVVLTNSHLAGDVQVSALINRVRDLAPGRPIFTADLAPIALNAIADRAVFPLGWIEGRRVAALSAVGNPSAFESMIGELGGILAARFRFRDHHELTLPQLEQAVADARAVGAEALITTEKDAVKIPPLKTDLPIIALQVRMQIDDEDDFVGVIGQTLQWQTLQDSHK